MKVFFIGVILTGVLFLNACVSQPAPLRTKYTMKSDGAVPESQKNLMITNAELHFTVFPKQKSISGKSILTLISSKQRSEIGIDLDSLFKIDAIKINDTPLDQSMYSNPEGLLKISLPTPISGEVVLTIEYSGKPRVAVNAPWDGGFVWSKTSQGKDWIATAVQGEGCDLFWPCIDYPVGEPKNLSMHITVPKDLFAAANGVLTNITDQGQTKTYHWQANSVQNTYGVALNIGPYEIIETTYQSIYGNTIPVYFYHLPESKEKAQELTKELLEITHFFEKFVGPYPFAKDKIGVVETPHLGMEHQTINAYGNHYKKDKYGFDWLLHHEFAHEWFANQLTNENADHMWLHEGFGAYLQPLYAQYLHGDYVYMAYMHSKRLGVRNSFPIVGNKTLSVEEVYQKETGPGGDIYSKASWVLHTLRNLIGDEHFFAASTELVYGRPDPQPGNFSPVIANTQDFLKIVNRVTGQDYTWFFDVYLYQASLPKVVKEQSEGRVLLSWQIENDKYFPMPLDISLNGKVLTLDLSTQVNIEVGPFDKLIIDPSSKVLKEETYVNEYQEFMEEARTLK
ncbi:M1 family metallopeptidase [Glaciecola petra]|uniref:M1 family metallopeptidase n=1 Tax=Glaciecola petra TaxID=3075602 RepID=A0ABU2ZRQ9_9ALTE|nr:M1 family metallopeptidase [Aestuariibacter sp. P117]MDT0595320.1 M1 family metallopeptidase [Aestuariibacter sp. P117]